MARSIILIENDNLTVQIISAVFRCAKYSVYCTSSGRVGVELALQQKSAHANEPVIVLAMNMPLFDGCLAARQLRHRGFDGPIIALTAEAGELELPSDDFDDVLGKPIRRDALLALAERYSSSAAKMRSLT